MTEQSNFPPYKELRYFVEHYGHPDVTDQRAVETFIDCETNEKIASLRGEVIAVSKNRFIAKNMQDILGGRRLNRHTSYQEWAKLMLLWMSSYKS